eukprot:jgi/Botrbrau1/16847/Bobra.150_2s0069.1
MVEVHSRYTRGATQSLTHGGGTQEVHTVEVHKLDTRWKYTCGGTQS